MSLVDARECHISGATPAALDAYERALAAFQGWRVGTEVQIELALREAPDFVMAYVLQAWLLTCSRDLQRVQSARAWLARAINLPGNEREQGHLAALSAVLNDDLDRCKALLGDLLREQPRDALALQVAHVFDYLTGDSACLANRVPSVLPAWSHDLPGYHAVLAMHAFGLEENGEYARAEEVALAALELNPLDARAHHVMAHVFEMSERPDEGIRWLNANAASWSIDTVVATHCWWHLALFHLAKGQIDEALGLYDRRIRAGFSNEVADLIDAAALLWRVDLAGGESGSRWEELAAAWAPHIDDAYCSFTDIHAMLAFVGAGDWDTAQRLERSLVINSSQPTRHGRTTRLLGLPAGRALIAYGQGDDSLAITLLASLPPFAHRLGGSHAQRDVLHLTLAHAVDRFRRPACRVYATAFPLTSVRINKSGTLIAA